jgi:hypothetical protein
MCVRVYVCIRVCRLHSNEEHHKAVKNAVHSVGLSDGPNSLVCAYAVESFDLGCQTEIKCIQCPHANAFILSTNGGVIIISGIQIRIITPLFRGVVCSINVAIERAYTSGGTLVLLTKQKEWLYLDLAKIKTLNQQHMKTVRDLRQIETLILALTERLLCAELTSLSDINDIRDQVARLKGEKSNMAHEEKKQEVKLRSAKTPVRVKLSIPSGVSLDTIVDLIVIGSIFIMVNITHMGRGRSRLRITTFCRNTGRLVIDYVEPYVDVQSTLCCTQTSETGFMIGVRGTLNLSPSPNGTIILAYDVTSAVLTRSGYRFLMGNYSGINIVSYGQYVVCALKGVGAHTSLMWLKPKTLEIPMGIFRPDVLHGFAQFMAVVGGCLVIGLRKFIYVYSPFHVVLGRMGYTNQSPHMLGAVFMRRIQLPAHSGHVMLAVPTNQMGLLLVIGDKLGRESKTRNMTKLMHIHPRIQRNPMKKVCGPNFARQNSTLKRPCPTAQNAAVSQPKKARITASKD